VGLAAATNREANGARGSQAPDEFFGAENVQVERPTNSAQQEGRDLSPGWRRQTREGALMLTGIISVPLHRNQSPPRYGQNFGENNGQAKLTEDQVRQIRKLALAGTFTLKEIGEMFGVANTNVWWIKHGLSWKHLWDDAPQKTENAGSVTANAE
jgi:hypothetical protein